MSVCVGCVKHHAVMIAFVMVMKVVSTADGSPGAGSASLVHSAKVQLIVRRLCAAMAGIYLTVVITALAQRFRLVCSSRCRWLLFVVRVVRCVWLQIVTAILSPFLQFLVR